jgi:beta-phosphoglucomutase-like phosphatase (HAD superfamily)
LVKLYGKAERRNRIAVISNMDGVIMDNTKYPILTWQKFTKRAGMKVIGVATSHSPKEISHTYLAIKNYRKN